jgi:methionine aminotransferase
MQWAYSEMLKDKDLYLQLGNFYQEKRDYFGKLISASKFKVLPCHSTYFQMLKYDTISEEKDTKFAQQLISKHKLAAIPVSAFYHDAVDNKVLRFCFAKNNQTLEKAAEILCKI